MTSIQHAIVILRKQGRITGTRLYAHGLNQAALTLETEYVQKEKQQIIDAYNQGYRDAESDATGGHSTAADISNFDDAEKYYKEKYNTNETI